MLYIMYILFYSNLEATSTTSFNCTIALFAISNGSFVFTFPFPTQQQQVVLSKQRERENKSSYCQITSHACTIHTHTTIIKIYHHITLLTRLIINKHIIITILIRHLQTNRQLILQLQQIKLSRLLGQFDNGVGTFAQVP